MTDFGEFDPAFFEKFVRAAKGARQAIDNFSSDFGSEALQILSYAIDERSQHYSEIIVTKSDLENTAMQRHSIYISNVLEKAISTKAFEDMVLDLAKVATEALPKIVDEIVVDDESR